MNNGIVKGIIVLAALTALSGCSRTAMQRSDASADRPILSAAEAQATIRVSVKLPESIAAEQTVALLAD